MSGTNVWLNLQAFDDVRPHLSHLLQWCKCIPILLPLKWYGFMNVYSAYRMYKSLCWVFWLGSLSWKMLNVWIITPGITICKWQWEQYFVLWKDKRKTVAARNTCDFGLISKIAFVILLFLKFWYQLFNCIITEKLVKSIRYFFSDFLSQSLWIFSFFKLSVLPHANY